MPHSLPLVRPARARAERAWHAQSLAARLALVPLFLLGLACNNPTGAEACSAASAGPFTIGPGTAPTISWAADCPAILLAVYSQQGLPMWEIVADRRRIPRPVAYGSVPIGTKEVHPVEPLQAGTGYSAILVIIVRGPDTLTAGADFTP